MSLLDDILKGVATAAPIVTGQANKPKPLSVCGQSKLNDDGPIAACLDTIFIPWNQQLNNWQTLGIPAQTMLQNALAIQATITDPNKFAKKTQYLQQAQDDIVKNIATFTQVIQAEAANVTTATGDPLTALTGSTELINGVPNTYLAIGAFGLIALIMLRH